jgi:hypothetical protein
METLKLNKQEQAAIERVARYYGSIGGRKSAAMFTPAQRKARARRAIKARWAKRKQEAAHA